MSRFTGVFLAEGTSDLPLAAIVEQEFFDRGVDVRLASPDFGRLGARVNRDIASRASAAVDLLGRVPDCFVVHRDADAAGYERRRDEILRGIEDAGLRVPVVPLVPLRMTEAWLLLDETAIRTVAGCPRGTVGLELPSRAEAERIADPKSKLEYAILTASEQTGRRRQQVARRFPQHRRQLLERLDPALLQGMEGWRLLQDSIGEASSRMSGR